jgi:hypothetical protein
MIKNIIIAMLLLCLAGGGYIANRTIDRLEQAIALLHVKHKKDILKTKARERGKRVLTAIPVAGLVALAWFEKREYDEWQQEHPDGTPRRYLREVSDATREAALEIADSYCTEDGIYCDYVKAEVRALTVHTPVIHAQLENSCR